MASSSDQALTTPSFVRPLHHLRNPLLRSLCFLISFLLSFLLYLLALLSWLLYFLLSFLLSLLSLLSLLLSWLLLLQPSLLLSWWLFPLACEPSLQLSLQLICYSSDSFCFCPALYFRCPCPCPFCLFCHLFWFLCPFSCYRPLPFSVCFLMPIPPDSRSHTHHNSWRSHSSSTRIHTPQGSEGIP